MARKKEPRPSQEKTTSVSNILHMNPSSGTNGPSGWPRSDGPTSSPLPLTPLDSPITQIAPSTRFESGSGGSVHVVDSSSGRSYTLADICTCMDYSTPLNGQIPLPLRLSSGETASRLSDAPLCLKCHLVRPYRITSLSTQ